MMEISMEDFVYAKRPEVKFNQYFDSNFPSRTTCCCMRIIIELFLEKNSDELATFELQLWILMKNSSTFCSTKSWSFLLAASPMHTGIHLNSLKATYQECMRKKTKTAQSRVKSTKRRRRQKRNRETAWYSHLDSHAF